MNAYAASIDAKSQLPDGDFHRALNGFNHLRFEPGLPSDDSLLGVARDAAFLRREGEFVERERREIRKRAQSAPRTADAFVEWFENLEEPTDPEVPRPPLKDPEPTVPPVNDPPPQPPEPGEKPPGPIEDPPAPGQPPRDPGVITLTRASRPTR